jgi:hypothetical protein
VQDWGESLECSSPRGGLQGHALRAAVLVVAIKRFWAEKILDTVLERRFIPQANLKLEEGA